MSGKVAKLPVRHFTQDTRKVYNVDCTSAKRRPYPTLPDLRYLAPGEAAPPDASRFSKFLFLLYSLLTTIGPGGRVLWLGRASSCDRHTCVSFARSTRPLVHSWSGGLSAFWLFRKSLEAGRGEEYSPRWRVAVQWLQRNRERREVRKSIFVWVGLCRNGLVR